MVGYNWGLLDYGQMKESVIQVEEPVRSVWLREDELLEVCRRMRTRRHPRLVAIVCGSQPAKWKNAGERSNQQ